MEDNTGGRLSIRRTKGISDGDDASMREYGKLKADYAILQDKYNKLANLHAKLDRKYSKLEYDAEGDRQTIYHLRNQLRDATQYPIRCKYMVSVFAILLIVNGVLRYFGY